TKRIIDMVGSLLFMAPSAILIWMYGWYFLWRHLVTPKPAASWTLERAERSAQAVRWNVETIGFSPNGFNGYFLFKILLVAFAGLVFLHAIAFFYRSYLEWKEGEESEGKYLDRDSLGEGEEAYEGTH
ncbi:MAG: C4-dicarboxylate ABC transporter permease, partial [Pseudomonadota bacterium]